MCIVKSELENKVHEIKSLKMLKEETENAIKALELEVIAFLQETEECKTTDKNGKEILQYIGSDYKANLVYSFLRKYRYSIEEYYNIAIFGLIKSAQTYIRSAELRKKYSFPYVAFQYMRAEISNHFKMENSKKRKPEEKVLSLDADYAETEIITAEALTELLENLTDIQRKITEMKLIGYSNKETYLTLEIKPSTYYKELQRIRSAVEKLLY